MSVQLVLGSTSAEVAVGGTLTLETVLHSVRISRVEHVGNLIVFGKCLAVNAGRVDLVGALVVVVAQLLVVALELALREHGIGTVQIGNSIDHTSVIRAITRVNRRAPALDRVAERVTLLLRARRIGVGQTTLSAVVAHKIVVVMLIGLVHLGSKGRSREVVAFLKWL